MITYATVGYMINIERRIDKTFDKTQCVLDFILQMKTKLVSFAVSLVGSRRLFVRCVSNCFSYF